MNNPDYVRIGSKKYKINTDFRIAIDCIEIINDDTIGDYERSLAVIYKLFGDEGLNNKKDYEKLLELAKKYLNCGKEYEEDNKEPDMDFKQDMEYIEASFMSDYNIDLSNKKMHWWAFYKLINGLSNSELGNCCILNRIRNLRNYDTKDLKGKEKEEIEKAKQRFALKKEQPKITEKQKESAEKFFKLTKGGVYNGGKRRTNNV